MTEDKKLRLFVAAAVPEEELERLERLIEPLRHQLPGARWTPPASRHVTLKFLGATSPAMIGDVERAIEVAAAGRTPARVSLDGLGTFPSARRVRVLWAGLDDASSLLGDLASALDRTLEPLGFASEKRAFTPHLTLARFREPIRLGAPLPALPRAESVPWEVASIELFRSYLSPRGARYEVIASAPLGT